MKRLALALIITATLLQGCVTPYGSSADSSTGGYSERRISEDHYIVTFSANEFTPPKKAHQFARIRAAEIGVKLGFDHFTILGTSDTSSSAELDLGSTSRTSGFGGANSFSSTTTTTPNTMSVYYPEINLDVKYFAEIPSGRYLNPIENCAEVFASLSSK